MYYWPGASAAARTERPLKLVAAALDAGAMLMAVKWWVTGEIAVAKAKMKGYEVVYDEFY